MLGGRRKYLPRNHEKEQPEIKWGNPSNSAPGNPGVSSQKTVTNGGKRCERAWPTTGWRLACNLVSRDSQVVHAKRSQSFLNTSSVRMVPSARQAARLVRFTISCVLPAESSTAMAASSSGVKNTLSVVLFEPYPFWIMPRIFISPDDKLLRWITISLCAPS